MKKMDPKDISWIDYKYNYLNPIGYAKGIRDELRRGNTEIALTAFLNLENPNSDSKRVNKYIYKQIKDILKENKDAVIVITGSRGNSVSVGQKVPVEGPIDGIKYYKENVVDKPKSMSYTCNVKQNSESKGEIQ